MKKLTVLIEGSKTSVDLDESLVVTNRITYIYVKKAYVFRSYRNVKDTFSAISLGGKVTKLHKGYHTFEDIKSLFTDGCTIEATTHNGGCEIVVGDKKLYIHVDLAKLIGFDIGFGLGPNATTNSDREVDGNNGLRYIKIRCDIVDNASNINEAGKKDDSIVSLPIPSDQPLFGSISEYRDIESKSKIDRGIINQLLFAVTDQDSKPVDIGKVLLELYIM